MKQLNVSKLAPIDLILKFNSNRSELEMLNLLNFGNDSIHCSNFHLGLYIYY